MTTENGLGPSNTIFLEPVVYEGLRLYAEEAEAFPTRPRD